MNVPLQPCTLRRGFRWNPLPPQDEVRTCSILGARPGLFLLFPNQQPLSGTLKKFFCLNIWSWGKTELSGGEGGVAAEKLPPPPLDPS